MASPLVSIVMPVRNAIPFLEECLESIVNQTYTNWELIAVNDHSTDLSTQLLEQFSTSHPQIQFLESNGKGIIDALNSGYANANGELITRMDADDIMPASKLEVLSSLLLNNGKGCLATGHVQYFSQYKLGDGFMKYEKWLNSFCKDNSHYTEIYKECVIPSPCWMMFKEDFDMIGAFDSKQYPEDYDLCFRMYKNNISVVSTDQTMHRWRDHQGRASRNDENYSDNRFLEMKVNYFLEIDHRLESKLVVWGAGKKGKRIAQLLLQKGVNFMWVTNNPNKIGKHIYNVVLSDQNIISGVEKASILIAVANAKEQDEIIKSIIVNHSIYKFC